MRARLLILLATLAIAACGPSETKAPAAAKPEATATTEAEIPLGQLGTAVVPTHYTLSLTVHPDLPRYSGMVRIEVKLDAARKTIYLHGKDFHVTLVKADLADGSSISGTYAEVHPTGIAKLTF